MELCCGQTVVICVCVGGGGEVGGGGGQANIAPAHQAGKEALPVSYLLLCLGQAHPRCEG